MRTIPLDFLKIIAIAFLINFAGISANHLLAQCEPLVFCDSDFVSASASNFNSDSNYSQVYVLYDPTLAIIVAANSTADFSNEIQDGTIYQIHALNFDLANAPSVLTNLVPEDLIGLALNAINDGCFNDDFESDYLCFVYFEICPLFCDGENLVQSDNAFSIHAGSSISSDATVLTDTEVSYKAGDYISLKPGFSSQPVARFDAIIEECQEAGR